MMPYQNSWQNAYPANSQYPASYPQMSMQRTPQYQPQIQQTFSTQIPGNMPTFQGLPGQIVDGMDAVKAKDVDMSGMATWYPKADGTEVYCKQLQPDGRSQILTYKLVLPENSEQVNVNQSVVDTNMLSELFSQLKTDIIAELSGIKSMLPVQQAANDSSKQRGGNQK